ncbi:hypothetical protein TL16_g06924 [Triparma laevis f. inornata]|uniref:Uncharacterized protein n=1 Tax=Triparma laevis f. inornata TaxID=1714386 RepID=A0A9W7EEJ4_9STRA|nr:hypothetical protein TL16_g06924 [Triparma laevis f. inornata]
MHLLNTLSRNVNDDIKMLYIPTALYAPRADSTSTIGKQLQRAKADGRKRRGKVLTHLRECTGKNVESVTFDLVSDTLSHPTNPKLNDVYEIKYDIIFIDGGNTFYLYSSLLKSPKMLELIKESFKGVYIGVSAGAIIKGLKIYTALWKGMDDPTVVEERDWETIEGLKSEDYCFFPHYEEKWKDLCDEKEGGEKVVRLREDDCYVSGVGVISSDC